jgi:hypothetical protein
MEGNLNAFTNPAIEAGLIHCRALLEFVGLGVKNGELTLLKKRKNDDDIGIEKIRNGALQKLDPETVLASYGDKRDEANHALLTVFEVTNKGVAHITSYLNAHPEIGSRIEIASRFVPWLLINNLYKPLNLTIPEYEIAFRPRDC